MPSLQCVDLKVSSLTTCSGRQEDLTWVADTVGGLNQPSRQSQRATFVVDLQRAGDAVFGEPAEVVEVEARVLSGPVGNEGFFGDGLAIGTKRSSLDHSQKLAGKGVELGSGLAFSFLGRNLERNGGGDLSVGDIVVSLGDQVVVQEVLDVVSLSDEDVLGLAFTVGLGLTAGRDGNTSLSDESSDKSLAELVVPGIVEDLAHSDVVDINRVGDGNKTFKSCGDLDDRFGTEGIVFVWDVLDFSHWVVFVCVLGLPPFGGKGLRIAAGPDGKVERYRARGKVQAGS